ncbi:MAG: citrate lyase holo-[Mogibacterium sp.]|nr:citrate lyase holo-[acyl-carrier protein] synthase [Mogibacterium sp.]
MKILSITLEQMLAARERRAHIQNTMLQGGCCLVCLTMNIAGEIKRAPLIRLLFERGKAEFEALGLEVLDHREIDDVTGCESFWLVQDDPAAVKTMLEQVEDSFDAARLFDFDVLVSGDGFPVKLSRNVSRRCLICDKPAAECARSRSHGLDAVKAATGKLLADFGADALADAAYNALMDELRTTPKPGLVDLANNGAHDDMDVPLFERSAESLKPYLRDAAKMGLAGCGMDELRARGLLAEREMFAATGGVNTHKGLIYSMGLILSGMGMALKDPDADDEAITELAVRYAADLAAADAESQLSRSLASPETNGGKVLKTYGARGATGEAAAGFPDAVYCAERLAQYREMLGVDNKKAGVLAFCDSMARLEDTNLLHRGGQAGLDFVKQEASRISAMADIDRRVSELTALD